LRRFAAAKGKATRYHETITWAYLLLIHERMKGSHKEQSWQEFAESNCDLLNWENSVLKKYYSDKTLSSDFAKQVFVFPDLRAE
jgi:hypothetical protein